MIRPTMWHLLGVIVNAIVDTVLEWIGRAAREQ